MTVLRTGQMTDSLPVSTAGVTGLSHPTDAMVAAPAYRRRCCGSSDEGSGAIGPALPGRLTWRLAAVAEIVPGTLRGTIYTGSLFAE